MQPNSTAAASAAEFLPVVRGSRHGPMSRPSRTIACGHHVRNRSSSRIWRSRMARNPSSPALGELGGEADAERAFGLLPPIGEHGLDELGSHRHQLDRPVAGHVRHRDTILRDGET